MKIPHKTVASRVSLTGVGLHTGAKSVITLSPADENSGILFKRVDIKNSPLVKASIKNVVGAARGTTIGIDNVLIYTIEHLMSALAYFQISNILIEIDAEEVPLMDGSAKPFVDAILEAGIKEQNGFQQPIIIDKNIKDIYKKGETYFSVEPSDNFIIDGTISFPSIGTQQRMISGLDNFADDLAITRTFCLFSELKMLKNTGLIKGATLNSGVVVQDKECTKEDEVFLSKLLNEDIKSGSNGFINNQKLHFEDELCRHKILDLIGDLYLLGRPIKGKIVANRSGHAANQNLVKEIIKNFI